MEREVIELEGLVSLCLCVLRFFLLAYILGGAWFFLMSDWLTLSRSFFGGVGSVAVWTVHSLEYNGLRCYG